jgi:hypothetical protein
VKPEYKEGTEALNNFKETAKKIFQVPKANPKPEKKPLPDA